MLSSEAPERRSSAARWAEPEGLVRITSRVVVVALLLMTLSAVGCSSHQAVTPATLTVPPSSPGTYTAGATITLANHAQIVVPAGWEASLNTTGA